MRPSFADDSRTNSVNLLAFVFQRLLVVGPTLVGVTLLSFALLSLAPAPTEGVQAEREERARSLFVELPHFYNKRPRDLARNIEIALRTPDAVRADEVEAFAAEGSVLLPVLVPKLRTLPPPTRDLALRILRPSLRIYLDPASEALPADETEELTTWEDVYEARRLDFRAVYVNRLVRRLLRAPSVETESAIVDIGSYALDVIMDGLTDARTDVQRASLLRVLARIAPACPAISHAGSLPERLHAWSEWWFVHRSDYVVFSEWERFFAPVAETRYGKWLLRLLTFELGTSQRDDKSIAGKLLSTGHTTFLLTLIASVLALALAIPFGVYLGIRQNSSAAKAANGMSYLLYATPAVWVATLLARVSGGHAFWNAAFCVACLAYPWLVVTSRFQRLAVLDVIRSDYVRTARAKGVSETSVVLHHVLRNALLPVVTLAGTQWPSLLSSAVVLETIFGVHGLGYETVLAVEARDVPWLVAVTAIGAGFSIFGVLVSDLVYALVDPRLLRSRIGEQAS